MTKNRVMLLLLGLLLAGGLLCQGCASIISKSEYDVRICSNPSGANFTIIDKKGEVVRTGTTPETVIDLKAGAGWFSGQDYKVKFTKPGYQPLEAEIEQGLDGWYLFGNLFFGGVIGYLIVDPLTGAMWTLKDLTVDLQPSSGACLPSDRRLKILTLNQVPENLRPRLVRIN